MTILTPAQRRQKRRFAKLPTATHDCAKHGVWIRRPKSVGRLGCALCGKP